MVTWPDEHVGSPLTSWWSVPAGDTVRPRCPINENGEVLVMAGKFVLKQTKSGKFHFNLLAGNGQVIASSEMYESKRAALNGIESVKKNAPDANTDDQTGG